MNMLKNLNDKPEDLLQKINAYANNPTGFFLLSGHNGCGKSFIAEALYYTKTSFKLPAYNSDWAIFVNQSDLNQEWKEKDREWPVYLLNKYKNTELLVLDDLGTRMPSDAFLDFLYSIIEYRWRNRDKLGTIITTNKNATQFRDIFGDAITSRVCSGFIYRLEGNDRRVSNF